MGFAFFSAVSAATATCLFIPQCPPMEHEDDPTVNCTLKPSGLPCPFEICVCDPVPWGKLYVF